MILKKIEVAGKFTRHSVLRRLLPKVHEDLTATYTRNLHKWLLIAPLIGLMAGLTITAVAVIILREMWPVVMGWDITCIIIGLSSPGWSSAALSPALLCNT
jgi:hypothetical protein